MRVFSLNDLFQVSPRGGPDSVGRQPNGAYHALGHKYVLPQTRAYDSVGLGLHFSQVSVDRTTGTPSLLVSEFRRKGGASPRGEDKAPRLVRWPLNPGTGAIAQQRDSGQFAMKGEWRIQGAVGIGGAYHFSLSNGDARGSLTSWKRGRPRPEPRELTKAPEDLSHHGSEKALWSLGEAAGNRYVYSVAVPPIPPRRA
ncbi:hypothetical protein [Streptomyces syringium]|uniref:hypothetical protein n=1 Tax=Streptomyces syringium TaxID=76729 RepID=UPI0033C66D10